MARYLEQLECCWQNLGKKIMAKLNQHLGGVILLSLLTHPYASSAQTLNPAIGTRDQTFTKITNVSQLRDISPEDWAYEALRNLIERYGCLGGYPNHLFRGERALTRWEFAASLNACLKNLERLFSESQADISSQIALLKRLTQEFKAELQVLGNSLDNLENRVASLEDHQFSTTTKLFGSIRFEFNAYSDEEAQASLQYSAFLALTTSFTGKDRLFTALGTTNTSLPTLAPTNDGREVGSTREGTSFTASSGDAGNQVRILGLEYRFPLAKNLNIDLVGANRYNFVPNFLPHFNFDYAFGQGPPSAFASSPPIYLVGGGSGLAVSYEFLPATVLTVTYLATFANEPRQGAGLFQGDYIAVAQLNYNPSRRLFLQLLYQNGYFGPGNFAFNSSQVFRDNGFIGSALANRFDDAGILFEQASPVSTNAYQIGASYSFTPNFSLGGWVNLIKARLLGKGDADIWTYSAQALFTDLFKEGNLGGFVVGMEPTLTGLDTNLSHPAFENDTSLHIELYYRYQMNNNISVTPYTIWITAPNQDADNQDIIIGGVRTVFSF
jgi:hypothetical protein